MSRTVVPFPNARLIREEACAWIARMDAGLTSHDKRALDAWLAQAPEHREALLELSRVWDEMDVLAELAELFPLKHPDRGISTATFAWRRWGLAALAASVIAVAWLGLDVWRTQGDDPTPLASTGVYRTDIGETSRVRLDDGSVLTLNTNTRLRVDYTSARRRVVLERGEATFEVAHDAARPFTVYAGRQVVEAIGTVFNVHLTVDDQLEVAVTEGRVRVLHRIDAPPLASPPGLPAPRESESLVVDSVVAAGQAVVVEQDISTLRRLEPEDIDVELAWQRGMLIFRGEPLETVLDEVGRYTTVEFELADDTLAAIRVGGYFRAGEVDGLLLALRENFSIQALRSGDKVTLMRVD